MAGRKWTATEDAPLGTKPDEVIAAEIGRSVGAVAQRRSHLGIPKFESDPPWTNAEMAELGKNPDADVARKLGRSKSAVKDKRCALAISAFEDRSWTKAEDALFASFSNERIAEITERTLGAVKQRRWTLGVAVADDLPEVVNGVATIDGTDFYLFEAARKLPGVNQRRQKRLRERFEAEQNANGDDGPKNARSRKALDLDAEVRRQRCWITTKAGVRKPCDCWLVEKSPIDEFSAEYESADAPSGEPTLAELEREFRIRAKTILSWEHGCAVIDAKPIEIHRDRPTRVSRRAPGLHGTTSESMVIRKARTPRGPVAAIVEKLERLSVETYDGWKTRKATAERLGITRWHLDKILRANAKGEADAQQLYLNGKLIRRMPAAPIVTLTKRDDGIRDLDVQTKELLRTEDVDAALVIEGWLCDDEIEEEYPHLFPSLNEWRKECPHLPDRRPLESCWLYRLLEVPPRCPNSGRHRTIKRSNGRNRFICEKCGTKFRGEEEVRLVEKFHHSEGDLKIIAANADGRADGPVPPNGFRYRGDERQGMKPKAFKAVRCLWDAKNRTTEAQEFAGPVWGLPSKVVTDGMIRGLQRDVREFFMGWCPLRITWDTRVANSRFVTLAQFSKNS